MGVLGLIVDAAEQDVLEGDPLALAQRNGLHRFEELGDVPFARDGHDLLADLVVGGVQAESELGADGSWANSGSPARCQLVNGHARLGDADLLYSSSTADELVVVEEGLAHAHEDEVDAVLARS